jgi:hypothetical protein
MRNMKNILGYTLMTGVLLCGFACTNLDEELPGTFTEKPFSDALLQRDNLNKATPNDGLQGAFSGLFAGTATNGGFFAVQEGGTDEAVITQKGGDWFDGGLYIEMHKHVFSPQTWAINDTWTHAYNGIFQTNTLLGDAEINVDPRKVAQLRTLRAYYMWRLMDVFGRIKLPTVAGVDVPQVNRTVAFDFIESELQEAIPDLSDGYQTYGRVSQGAAYALLCRLYLNSEVYTGTPRYQQSIDLADSVIDLGVYELDEDYSAVFGPKNVENTEHIFVVPFDEATGTGSTWAQMTLHYPSQLTYRLQQQPWNGFSTLEDFYNSYDDADKRKAANFIVGPQFDTKGNPILDLAYDKGDEDGAPINYTPKINMLAPNASRQGGARFGKFAFKPVGQLPDMDNDFPLLRYGEVLLNKAEALFRLNGYGDATGLALVNQLRERAGATPYGTITEGEFLAERGRELFVEALRRTDLIRFGAYGNAWWEKPADANPNHNIMAIPLQQMNASATSPFPLTQNTGY